MKNQNKWPDFRFNLEEIAGAVGDYGTLIPIFCQSRICRNYSFWCFRSIISFCCNWIRKT